MPKDFFWGKRVVITGAAGFIGSHLVEALLQRDAKITAVVRPEHASVARNLESVRDRLVVAPVSLENDGALRTLLEGADVVFHLAANTGPGVLYSSTHQATMCRDNLHPFIHVIEAARASRVGRFVVCSSACVYPADAQNPIPEEEGFRSLPQESNEGYGMAKRMQEYLGTQYAREFGMHVAIARPFNAYGPRDHFDATTSHVIPGLIRKALTARDRLDVWGTGTATRAFLYVEDFARGLIAVAEKAPVAVPINLGPAGSISIRELALTIVSVCGREGLPLEFDATKPEGQMQRSADTRRAEKLLGFRPRVSLEEGLRRTINWFREEIASGRAAL